MKTLFSKWHRLFLLWFICILQVSGFAAEAKAECKLGSFHLEAISDMPIRELARVLHDSTGCNFIFHPKFLDNKLSIIAGDFKPVSLMSQLAKKLKSELTVQGTLLVLSPTKLELKGTGKLVSLDLVDAPVNSVNQIIKKLGAKEMVTAKEGSKLTVSLSDVPLDDLVSLLDFQLQSP